jgi:hypothetical protein
MLWYGIFLTLTLSVLVEGAFLKSYMKIHSLCIQLGFWHKNTEWLLYSSVSTDLGELRLSDPTEQVSPTSHQNEKKSTLQNVVIFKVLRYLIP